MSSIIAQSQQDTSMTGFVVVGPRTSDPISGALRAAYGLVDIASDDFADLLLRIDVADRDASNH